jgi:hypothetical protein
MVQESCSRVAAAEEGQGFLKHSWQLRLKPSHLKVAVRVAKGVDHDYTFSLLNGQSITDAELIRGILPTGLGRHRA